MSRHAREDRSSRPSRRTGIPKKTGHHAPAHDPARRRRQVITPQPATQYARDVSSSRRSRRTGTPEKTGHHASAHTPVRERPLIVALDIASMVGGQRSKESRIVCVRPGRHSVAEERRPPPSRWLTASGAGDDPAVFSLGSLPTGRTPPSCRGAPRPVARTSPIPLRPRPAMPSRVASTALRAPRGHAPASARC
jgi:hypothetical protein